MRAPPSRQPEKVAKAKIAVLRSDRRHCERQAPEIIGARKFARGPARVTQFLTPASFGAHFGAKSLLSPKSALFRLQT
jgi:hypothetical protein